MALVIIRLEANGTVPAKGYKWTLTGGAGIVIMLGIMSFIYSHSPLNFGAIILINNFLIPLPIVLFYFGLIREKTFISQILAGRISGVLGRSSYSFYLLHTIVINYLSIPILLSLFQNRLLCVLFTFVITWFMSIMLFMLYEEPLNIFIRKKFRSKDKTIGMTKTLFPAKN